MKVANIQPIRWGNHSFNTGSGFTLSFVQKFQEGIQRLIAQKTEGARVTALANLNFFGQIVPSSIFEGINPERHKELIEQCLKRVTHQGTLRIDSPFYESRGEFQIHFNEVRGFRPLGIVKQEKVAIDEPFNVAGWNYNKIDPAEIITSGQTHSKPRSFSYDLLYNLFPYAPFHFLIVFDKKKELNQFLGGEQYHYLKAAWDFLQEAGEPNLRLAYNSLGAYSSVNHLHFQGFFVTNQWQPPFERIFPVTHSWPVRVVDFFTSPNTMLQLTLEKWHDLAKRHPDTVAYNLYITPGGIYAFLRKHQFALSDIINKHFPFTTGPVWIETLGTVIIPKEEFLPVATSEKIQRLLESLNLGYEIFSSTPGFYL